MAVKRTRRGGWSGLLLAALGAGCGELGRDAPGALPSLEEVRSTYEAYSSLRDVEVSGNVVQLSFDQDAQQLRRGGSLWARVGPYIYLFSPATRELFEGFPGVAAARVVTSDPRGREVARATLRRDALTDILWRRSLNLMGRAVQEGGQRPSRLEELVDWGERHTEYVYSEEYVPQ